MSSLLFLGYFIVKPRLYLILVAVMLFLTACSSTPDLSELVAQNIAATRQQMEYLSESLDNDSLRNGVILRKYSTVIAQQRPDVADLAYALARDAKPFGSLYTNLEKRLNEVSDLREGSLSHTLFPSMQDRLQELNAIRVAASNEMFNDALSDPVNVLADLSGGALPRVAALSKEATLAANGAADLGVGSQLVGNPNYGRWQSGSNGSSFWEFYGKYALFSSLIGRPYSYGYWSRNRDYSYYHDVGAIIILLRVSRLLRQKWRPGRERILASRVSAFLARTQNRNRRGVRQTARWCMRRENSARRGIRHQNFLVPTKVNHRKAQAGRFCLGLQRVHAALAAAVNNSA